MNHPTDTVNWKKTLLLCSVILAVATLLVFAIFSTEPSAEKSGATKQTAMLVEVTDVARGSYRPTFIVTGTVRPERDITLTPQVDGRVLSRSKEFTPGGFVEEGEVLLKVDPADYRTVLRQQKSALSQVETQLQLEMGQQEIAQDEYEQLVDGELRPKNRELMLREPQLVAAKSKVEAAEAAVRQAQLDLSRTTIQAPFMAQVINRSVDVGSRVSPTTNLGRLVGIEKYWVEVSVPLSLLHWLRFPPDDQEDKNDKGETEPPCSEARIVNPSTWPPNAFRLGCLFRLVGILDEDTRMARVLLEVDDPLARSEKTPESAPPLMIGEFVEAHLEARQLSDVVRISRDYVRKNDTAWVMEEGTLKIVPLEIVVRDSQYAYVSSGLSGTEKIVTTNLSTVTKGASLRIEGAESGR